MKGAFTGATSNKQGLFEAANGGTIFLDEISATTPGLQIKLLRVLQEREFMRVGGTTAVKVDVHVIVASNRNLLAEVAKGTFREDLFYRLNVIPIQLPPLRERNEDIPLLVDFFLKKYAKKDGQSTAIKKIDPAAMKILINYNWPGNVRELENTIERLVIMTPNDIISQEHIPDTIKKERPSSELVPLDIPDTGVDLEKLLENAEKMFLRKGSRESRGRKDRSGKTAWPNLPVVPAPAAKVW